MSKETIEKTVQNAVLKLFTTTLGYRYLGDLHWEQNKNIREEDLQAYLLKHYPADLAQAAAARLLDRAATAQLDLYTANKEVYSLLRYGTNVKTKADETATTVQFIDWANPDANDFAIAEEVTVVGNATKRPDLVLYVNGIALAVIELKKGSHFVTEGIRQNLTNQKPEFIEHFFTTIQLCLAGNRSEGVRYGAIRTPEQYYLEWKNDKASSDPITTRVLELCAAVPPSDKLTWQLIALCQKARFLELIHDFILFDNGVKKIARYNQYYAVKEAQQRVRQGKGGIIWHTQGSGKTLTMVMLSAWIRENMPNARILLITDRRELDEQMQRTFRATGDKGIYRATSGADLAKQLNTRDKTLICSLIHKFGDREGKNLDATDKDYDRYFRELKAKMPKGFEAKDDFYVFVDECHRTQSGMLHAAMKCLLPKAVFIGFTGTPRLRAKPGSKRSSDVFADGYIHIYNYKDAVQDKVVLDLRYTARHIPQEITSQEAIDQWFALKTQGLNDNAKAKLKKRWGTLQKVFSSRPRMQHIAMDIAMDFELKPRLKQGLGNAMLVADSILNALRYWEILSAQGIRCAAITSYEADKSELATDTADLDQETETAEKLKLQTAMTCGKTVEAFEEEAIRQFKEEPAAMQMLIVVARLLTGFDAPKCTYLYIDRKIRDLDLFQAVCRVNRLDDEKDYGYIVDYQKLWGELQDSMDQFNKDPFSGLEPEDTQGLIQDRAHKGRADMDDLLDELAALTEGVQPPRGETEYIAYFVPAGTEDDDELKAQEALRQRFYALSSKAGRLYGDIKPDLPALGYTEEERKRLHERVKHFMFMAESVGRASGDTIDLHRYTPAMRTLINMYISAGLSEKIDTLDNFTLLNFIREQTETVIADEETKPVAKEQKAAAAVIEANLAHEIVVRRTLNPKYYQKMSELLQGVIADSKKETADYRALLEKFRQIAENVLHPENSGRYPADVAQSAPARAYYDCLDGNQELALALDAVVREHMMEGFRYSEQKRNNIKGAIWKTLGDALPGLDKEAHVAKTEEIFALTAAQEEYR